MWEKELRSYLQIFLYVYIEQATVIILKEKRLRDWLRREIPISLPFMSLSIYHYTFCKGFWIWRRSWWCCPCGWLLQILFWSSLLPRVDVLQPWVVWVLSPSFCLYFLSQWLTRFHLASIQRVYQSWVHLWAWVSVWSSFWPLELEYVLSAHQRTHLT